MTIRTIAIIVLALLGPALSGCGAHTADPGGLSLMDRWQTGQELLGEGEQGAALLTARGDAARESGRPDLALRLYDQALENMSKDKDGKDAEAGENDPAIIRARLGKGLALLDSARSRAALAEFTALLAEQPGNAQAPYLAEAHEGAGRACLDEGLPEQAATHLRAALDAEPRRASSLRFLGAAHTRLGEHGRAAEAYLAAVDLDWTDTDSWADAGMSLALTGRYGESLEAFMRVVRQGRLTARTYNNMGLVLYRLGRNDQALAAFTAAGGEAAAYNNLGWFLFQDGRYLEAVNAFTRAMELSPAFYVRASENLKRARLAQGLRPAPARSADPSPAPRAMEPLPVIRASHAQSPGPAAVLTAARPEPDEERPAVSPGDGPWRPETVQETGPVYTVHVSSWQTRKHARLNALNLERGPLARLELKAFVFKVDLGDKGLWWRVTAGNYKSLDEARAAMARLEGQGLKDLRIIRRRPARHDGPAVPDVRM